MIEYEQIDATTALRLAKEVLVKANKLASYKPENIAIRYTTKDKFSDGSRKGWIIIIRMEGAEGFDPDRFYINVSDPSGVAEIFETL